ncbi:MAG TPA: hypothetical protein P5513_04025 [Candidatus Diapherotrites archaeon]|nr:hypothetical protein [Candidatus Diapherotrites archaeon]
MKKSVIKFYRSRDVKLPSRAYKSDAGMDFFIPKFDKKFVKDLLELNPHLKSNQITNDNQNGFVIITCNYNDNSSFIKFDEEEGKNYFILFPHSRVNIPSGIYCKMEEEGRALIAANKSGIASKYGIIFGAQVVDYQYQGEIHINLINVSSNMVKIYEDQKIIQFIETPVFTSDIKEVEDMKDLYESISERSNGGFGSTDKK